MHFLVERSDCVGRSIRPRSGALLAYLRNNLPSVAGGAYYFDRCRRLLGFYRLRLMISAGELLGRAHPFQRAGERPRQFIQ